AWPDANNDGRIDGASPILRETSLKIWHNGTAITGQCANATYRPANCTTTCCDQSANTWAFQTMSFSEFSLGEPACTAVSIPKLKASKLTLPGGDDKFGF